MENSVHANRLTDDERAELDHLLQHYPVPSGANIDALKMIQRHHGWVSDQHLAALSAYMQVPVAELESVATFYNLIFRKPVGDYLVHPCDGVSCLLMGYRNVQEQLQKTLAIDNGETTEDNTFTLIPLPCLGACDKAPVMLINETLYENLKPNQIGKIIDTVAAQAKPL